MLAFFKIIRSPITQWIGLGLVVAGLCVGGYLAVFNRGMAACEGRHQLAAAEAAAAAHQRYLSEVARGDAISAELIKTQRRLNDVKTEYLAYANGITGNCPADLGVLVNAAVSGAGMPQAASRPVDPSATIAAALVAANVAENYGRANACIAQFNALIDWHQPEKAVK